MREADRPAPSTPAVALDPERRLALRRQARLAQMLTVAWMVVEGAISVGAGITARSVALSAFGIDSLIEIFSAAVVLRVLLQPAPEVSAGRPPAGERAASRLVGWALCALIGYIFVSTAATLVLGLRPEPSGIGLGVVAVSVPVMTFLWRWRLALAERLSSPALRGDAACSVVCLYLAAATLAGLSLNMWLGLWWADPLAGFALVWWIKGEAREALEAARA